MTGVSYMIPFVVAGGLLIAIGFALGGIYVYDDAHKGTLAANLFWIGKASFQMMIPILAGYAAFSIADRPGIAPGMIAGVIAESIGAGFLGGIVGGFLAGYLVRWLNQTIQLPRTLEGLKPVLILPLLGATLTGLLMYYVVGAPVGVGPGRYFGLAEEHAGEQCDCSRHHSGQHDGFRHGRTGQQGGLHLWHRPAGQQHLRTDGRHHGRRDDPAAGHRAGDDAFPQPFFKRRT
jgi:PTS system D-fructose-specific IIB component (F1P-forming), Frc family (TC 4.A.2.1.1)/PTS system D-fructose-specific IIC component (F1P-forming), Frc family (TC 4.A.2.1.1)